MKVEKIFFPAFNLFCLFAEEVLPVNEQNTIAFLIRQLLEKIFKLVAVTGIVMIVSLYLFTSYTAVVNEAGIVRGGSQRIVKQVLAGADASQATEKVEGLLKKLDGAILLGGFSGERDKVAAYWNKEVKPAMTEYKSSKNPAHLLEVSETYFGLTNAMVDAAQNMVDIMAYILYILLIAFVAAVGFFLRKIFFVFRERVAEPIAALEGSINKLAQGNLNQKLNYDRSDEIGKLYDLLNKMRVGLSGYVQDIERNLRNMADGDFVTATDMKYIGDYAPIQSNIENIRNSLCGEIHSMNEIADKVAESAGEVSQVSKSLAEGAMSQTESIQQLQAKIQETMEQNACVENFVRDALQSGEETMKSIENSRLQMDKVVDAMHEINKASEEIKSILGALDEITGQTALLSLNASIEAARAGEAGRGFAVVADEVRKLAEQSAQSTQNIQNLITNALAGIAHGTSVVGTAAESLSGVTENTEAVTKVINRLSDQSKKQQSRMEEVNSLSQTILGVVTDNSAVSEECAAASSELSNYSDSFKESVGKFRTA